MLKILPKTIRENLAAYLLGGAWFVLLAPRMDWLVAYLHKEKNTEEAWALLLTILLSTCLSVLYLAKIIKEKFSYLDYRENLYWKGEDPKPFCPICKDKDKENRRLSMPSQSKDTVFYECFICKHQFYKKVGAENFNTQRMR